MDAEARTFWSNLKLGHTSKLKAQKPRPKRTLINVVMFENSINRGRRTYSFPSKTPDPDETLGVWYGRVSVVLGPPGKVAVSTIKEGDKLHKLRAKYIGEYGADYYKVCESFATRNACNEKPAVVVAVDSTGGVLGSWDMCVL